MNRRAFLFKAGTTAVVATGGLGLSRKLFSQSYDSNLVSNAIGSHTTLVANLYNGNEYSSDYYRAANDTSAFAQNWDNTGTNGQFISAFQSLTPDQMNTANADFTKAVQGIQQYAPGFQYSDAQQLAAPATNDQGQIAASLAQLQQEGITPTLQRVALHLNYAGSLVSNSTGMVSRSPFAGRTLINRDVQARLARSSVPGMTSDAPARIAPMPDPSGGGGYSCADDTYAGLATALALVVVGFMCITSVVAIPICVPEIAWVVSVGTLGWGAGHVKKCGA